MQFNEILAEMENRIPEIRAVLETGLERFKTAPAEYRLNWNGVAAVPVQDGNRDYTVYIGTYSAWVFRDVFAGSWKWTASITGGGLDRLVYVEY